MGNTESDASVRHSQAGDYPWHESNWSALPQDLNRLPHALLLHGPAGIAKTAFAVRLTHLLLCQQRGSDMAACGRCKSCLLLNAGTHPDFFRIEPLEPGKPITVDQIRALGNFLVLRPHTAARKATLIAPAEAMNLNAANSLLKLLEEPPLGSLLVLVSSCPRRLPATIRSRCSGIRFGLPATPQALPWLASRDGNTAQHPELLELARGAPLVALALAQAGFIEQRDQLFADLKALRERRTDPVTCATHWRQIGSERSFAWLYGFVSTLIKAALAVPTPEFGNPGKSSVPDLNPFINGLNLEQLFEFLDLISRSRILVGGPLDEQLLLEDVLVRWCHIAA